MTDNKMAIACLSQLLEESRQVVRIVQFHSQLKACGERCGGVSRSDKVTAVDVLYVGITQYQGEFLRPLFPDGR